MGGTMYAFIVGFNEWVLKGWVAGQGWKRSKSKDASGWEHDGQVIRELKAPEALAGMSGRNCKLIVVKPEKRGGYMPSQVMTSALKEAKRRGIPIVERIHAPQNESGPRQGIPRPARGMRGGMHVGDAL
jgi:hypothetical protein